MNIPVVWRSIAVALVLGIGICAPVLGQTALLQMSFQATVESVNDPDGLLGDAIEAASVFNGSLAYDPATTDASEAPGIGVYEFASSARIALTIGSLEFASDLEQPSLRLEVINDQVKPRNEGIQDIILFRSFKNLTPNPEWVIEDISWQIEAPQGDAITSKALPDAPLNLSKWQSVYGLTIRGRTLEEPYRSFAVRAVITTLTLSSN